MSSNDRKETLEQMVTRVINQKEDWSKHIAQECCRCQKCTCGKHLCKFQPLKINLKPSNTTYHDSYKNQPQILSESHRKLCIPIETYEPSQFIKKSEYQQEYYRKKAKQEQPPSPFKRQDNLELGGPACIGTTYQTSYVPKYVDPPSQIKNPQNLTKAGSRMNATSTYQHNYNWSSRKPAQREQPSRKSDNIKTVSRGMSGESSYQHDYHRPSSDYNNGRTVPHQEYIPCRGLRPKSSYRCDYRGQSVQQCPALRCPIEKCC